MCLESGRKRLTHSAIYHFLNIRITRTHPIVTNHQNTTEPEERTTNGKAPPFLSWRSWGVYSGNVPAQCSYVCLSLADHSLNLRHFESPTTQNPFLLESSEFSLEVCDPFQLLRLQPPETHSCLHKIDRWIHPSVHLDERPPEAPHISGGKINAHCLSSVHLLVAASS
ncbi:hypothetical protein NPIL_13091 [Nephila pilipes]|uniref:Uncharacterized protein n=1 Tax=Nephila pilipes TaxID=299642 RepID=A0A8X6UGG3_NEPPI|nr:hypothetical protein NPIL_13091 [Nephila pilipes]